MAVLLATLVVGQSSIAGAVTRESRERTARASCLAGDYAAGVELLSQLFVETLDPTYIFNQGRCFEQNGRYVDAIARFREFLRIGTKASAEAREAATSHIADCQALLDPSTQPETEKRRAGKMSDEKDGGRTVAANETVASEGARPSVETSRPAADRGRGLRIAGVATAAAGAAVMAAGVLLNVKANSIASEYDALDGYSDAKESDRKTYEKLGWAGYAVGGAGVLTGAILYYLGWNVTSEASVAIVPAGSGGVMAGVKGAF